MASTSSAASVAIVKKDSTAKERATCDLGGARSHRILRPAEVAARLGISRSKLYEIVATNDKFPARKKISARVVGWLESDIDDFIASLPNK
ncbi:helix-turn-helix transcriptional regulator [Burkholderia gladioli]|uniref:helix-turn-helix transcriptional regulator n=1 Tax=Burkholderia gladioli TaxID=28095 RepID=UPI001ABAE878|nr:AlpA family phage regulatory protein [Burkholderia gladioli]